MEQDEAAVFFSVQFTYCYLTHLSQGLNYFPYYAEGENGNPTSKICSVKLSELSGGFLLVTLLMKWFQVLQEVNRKQ